MSTRNPTVADLWSSWRATVLSRARQPVLDAHTPLVLDTMLEDGRCLRAIRTRNLDVAAVASWLRSLSSTRSQRTGRVLSAAYREGARASLSACLAFHVREGALLRNPLDGLPHEDASACQRHGYFDPASLEAYLPHCHPMLADMLRIIVTCGGLRAAEVIGLRKSHLDHATKSLMVRNKGGKCKRTLVPSGIWPIFVRLASESPSEWLFPSPRDPRFPVSYSTVRDWNQAARERAGIELMGEKPVAHHARHANAVEMLRHMPPQWVADQLGHRDTSQLPRYGGLRGAAEDIARGMLERSAFLSEAQADEAERFPA